MSPLFSEKPIHKESIILKKNNETVTGNYKLTETFNKQVIVILYKTLTKTVI